jgi:hypothetical protein
MNNNSKPAAWLQPEDRITLHGKDQTVAHTETWVGPTIAVFTDYTGDNPWLLKPAEKVTITPAGGE